MSSNASKSEYTKRYEHQLADAFGNRDNSTSGAPVYSQLGLVVNPTVVDKSMALVNADGISSQTIYTTPAGSTPKTVWKDESDHTKNFGFSKMGHWRLGLNIIPRILITVQNNTPSPYSASETWTVQVELLDATGATIRSATASGTVSFTAAIAGTLTCSENWTYSSDSPFNTFNAIKGTFTKGGGSDIGWSAFFSVHWIAEPLEHIRLYKAI